VVHAPMLCHPQFFFWHNMEKKERKKKKKIKEKDYLENRQFGLSLYFIVLKE
jgi:hypothetical protein